ncbi:hypothetical protein [Desulfurispira natronophila]|uniref:glutathione synthase n=1 Tax=Desulfurispira natronophila TaxID=682562 RepID=A0A7W7Y2N0_9BACT|nr:hypothetical protein [Desulfurispira natronophila]MBB5020961.1 glutathione synthase [Desulfurispira natronophila]
MLNRTAEAVDFALTHGMLQYSPDGKLRHAPLCTSPYHISYDNFHFMVQNSLTLQSLTQIISMDKELLIDLHAPLQQHDPFIATLLDIARSSLSNESPWRFHLSRSDFMLDNKTSTPKFVEINTIAASFHGLAQMVAQLQNNLARRNLINTKAEENPVLSHLVAALERAVNAINYENPCLLMVVQPDERNVFDQRLLQYAVQEQLNMPFWRMSLDEVAQRAKRKGDTLYIENQPVAMVYLRSGYGPNDYDTPDAVAGRILIEQCHCLRVPDIFTQLAGTKLTQHYMCSNAAMKQYLSPEQVDLLAPSIAPMYRLDDMSGNKSMRDIACLTPECYVLKPQREGGGHNLYYDDIPPFLENLPLEQYSLYVLMDKINAITHPAELVVNQHSQNIEAISEIGWYGAALYHDSQCYFNQNLGYLVRTKSVDSNEGGVCSGYACLNAISVDKPQ